MKLHGFFRSSAAYRVRIVLNLKGIPVEHSTYALRKGEQRSPDYLRLNPQGLVPSLVLDDGVILTQSLAIIDYLDEKWPTPALLPKDAVLRAKVRAFALAIACDIHPVQNLKVLNALKAGGFSAEAANAWAADVNREGLLACEALLEGQSGPFCFGDAPTLADVCLVPQMANARRFGADISACRRLIAADAAARALPAFAEAAPEKQPDAE